ncbi:MAG: hypothetical protein LBT54_06810, partial [Bifidobacteriaceae bacterium]|nr:hypothetical protein [Bifidobacteriaceae bacterium]
MSQLTDNPTPAAAGPDLAGHAVDHADNQAEIGGQRVELQEVEHAVSRLPYLTGAAAVAAPDHAGEMAITAFITADAPLDTTAVRRDLAHRM